MEIDQLTKFECKVNRMMYRFLLSKKVIKKMLPEVPDIEDKWASIRDSYLPDGAREFNAYPLASLGWMMFIGMAMACFWDSDWEHYKDIDDIYAVLRDMRGYDDLDDCICHDILALDEVSTKIVSDLVADTSDIAFSALMRQGFEAGTPEAFNAYVRCLHQLYFFGYAVMLNFLGYQMTRFNLN